MHSSVTEHHHFRHTLHEQRTMKKCSLACRDSYPRYVVGFLWITQEVAITACDLAEVIGSAVALKLLFGCPLIAGVWVTALDVLILLFTAGSGFRVIEGNNNNNINNNTMMLLFELHSSYYI